MFKGASKADAAVLGAIIGAFVLSAIEFVLLVLIGEMDFEFDMMFVFVSVPSGLFLGAAAGVSYILAEQKKTRLAGILCLLGGALVALDSLRMLLTFGEWSGGSYAALCIWYGTPFVGGMALIYYGCRLLKV